MKRLRGDADVGMTLVETLVAMMLLTVVIGLSTGSLINAMDGQSNVTQSTQAQNANQIGMELLTRLIRQAVYPTFSNATSTIITDAEANRIVFTSRLSGTATVDPTMRQYTIWLDGTDLKMTSAALVGTCSATPCTFGTPTATKVLVQGVRNYAGATTCPANTSFSAGPFQYAYIDSTGAPQTATFPIDQTTLVFKQLTYVKIMLFTQTQTGPRRPDCRALTDYVQLRNKQ